MNQERNDELVKTAQRVMDDVAARQMESAGLFLDGLRRAYADRKCDKFLRDMNKEDKEFVVALATNELMRALSVAHKRLAEERN